MTRWQAPADIDEEMAPRLMEASGKLALLALLAALLAPPHLKAQYVTLTPTSLDFGNQIPGNESDVQVVTVTNSGAATLNFTSISITGANSADYGDVNTCVSGYGNDGSVATGSTCYIYVAFTPSAVGTRTASISIFDNANNSPQTISLTGTGQEPEVPPPTLSATDLAFGSQVVGLGSPTQNVTVTNVGAWPLIISGITITGTNSADYAETSTCGSSVAPSASLGGASWRWEVRDFRGLRADRNRHADSLGQHLF